MFSAEQSASLGLLFENDHRWSNFRMMVEMNTTLYEKEKKFNIQRTKLRTTMKRENRTTKKTTSENAKTIKIGDIINVLQKSNPIKIVLFCFFSSTSTNQIIFPRFSKINTRKMLHAQKRYKSKIIH